MATDPFDDELLQLKKRARWRLIGAVVLIAITSIVYRCAVDTEPLPKTDKGVRIETVGSDARAMASNSSALTAPLVSAAVASPAHSASAASATTALAAAAVKRARVQAAATTAPATPASAVRPPVKPVVQVPQVAAPRVTAPQVTAPRIAAPQVVAPVAKRPMKKPAPVAKPPRVQKPAAADDSDDSDDDSGAASPAAGQFVVQIAAFADAAKAHELQSKLKAQGIHAYTDTRQSNGKLLTRVRVGPFRQRADAEKARAKVALMGLNGIISGQ